MVAELHCHSHYSLLDGASSPKALVARAAELDMPALALTDHDAVYGVIPFVRAAEAAGVHPVMGAEVTLTDGSHLTLLVENAAGWSNLYRLITRARLRSPKGTAALPFEALADHHTGLIALSGCEREPIGSLAAGTWQFALTVDVR